MPTNSTNRRPFEKEPGEGKAHEMQESPAEEVREGSEDEEKMAKKPARKNRKVPMDSEGGACCNTKKGKAKCSACVAGKPCPGKAMKDADCGMKKRSDALTAPEYLAACELGIQNRSRPYIRARLDATKAKTMEKQLRNQADKKGLPKEAANAYVYGTMNKVGYKQGSKTTKKGKAKVKADATYAKGFNVDFDQLAI